MLLTGPPPTSAHLCGRRMQCGVRCTATQGDSGLQLIARFNPGKVERMPEAMSMQLCMGRQVCRQPKGPLASGWWTCAGVVGDADKCKTCRPASWQGGAPGRYAATGSQRHCASSEWLPSSATAARRS